MSNVNFKKIINRCIYFNDTYIMYTFYRKANQHPFDAPINKVAHNLVFSFFFFFFL